MAFTPRPGPGVLRFRRPTTRGIETTPKVYSINPNADQLVGGVSVTITGERFATNALGTAVPSVLIGGTPATSIVLVNSTTITCVVPAHASASLVDLVVTNPDGQSATLPTCFTYLTAVILNIAPDHGPIAGGTVVFITGANFPTSPTVLFGTLPATSVVRIDAQHIACTSPAHAQGVVDISVNATVARGAFFFTLLTRGDDLRRNPSINIHESINAPSSCTFTVDGSSSPPREGEEFIFKDDNNVVMFAGVVQTVQQQYDDSDNENQDLSWFVTCTDYTPWLNRRRPIGTYTNVSATDIVRDLIKQYAPWVTLNHLQTGLCQLSETFDGTQDFAAVLTQIAKDLGGGYWRLDYTKDLHFFRVITVPAGNGTPAAPIAPVGGGQTNPTAMSLSQSGSTIAGFSFSPGFYTFSCAFKYSNGIVSTPGPFSELVLLDGHHLASLINIPIGASMGGLTVTARIVYYKFFGLNGGVSLAAGFKIADNVTTTYTGSPTGRTVAGTSFALGGDSTVPRIPAVAPPAGPARAPSADQTQNAARMIAGQTFPDTYGPSGGLSAFTYGKGTFAFKLAAAYDDGSESLPSPASGRIDLDGFHGVRFSTNNHGDDVNGASVIFWKVYASKVTQGEIPDFSANNTSLWTVIPNNTNGTYEIVPIVKQDNLVTVATTQSGGGQPATVGSGGVQADCVPGPNPEDASAPSPITDSNLYLLRQPRISSTRDISQLRNRIIVLDKGTVEYPPILTPVPIQQPPPAPAVGLIDQYGTNGGQVCVGAFAASWLPSPPAEYVQNHPAFKPFINYPINNMYLNGLRSAGNPTTQSVGGVKTGGSAKQWLENKGFTVDYILANPYTVFMDLPANWYDAQEAIVAAGTPAAAPNSNVVTTTADLTGSTQPPKVTRNRYQVDDLDSQAYMGKIELDANGAPTDGIHEEVISTDLTTQEECIAFGRARLAQFAWPLIQVKYSTRDPHHPGQTVHFDLSDPPIKGDFLVLEVVVDQIKDDAETTNLLTPRYNVTAADPVKFNFDDLLLLISDAVAAPDAGMNMADHDRTMQQLQAVLNSQINSIPAGALSIATVDVTDTQLLAMSNVTPLNLVNAGGLNTIMIPIWAQAEKISTNAFSSLAGNPTLNFFWGPPGTGDFAGFNFGTMNMDLTVGNRSVLGSFSSAIPAATNYASRDPRNRPISIIAAGALSAGSGPLGSLKVRIVILYYKITSQSTGT